MTYNHIPSKGSLAKILIAGEENTIGAIRYGEDTEQTTEEGLETFRKYSGYINHDAATAFYGKVGVKRFYESVFGVKLAVEKAPRADKGLHSILLRGSSETTAESTNYGQNVRFGRKVSGWHGKLSEALSWIIFPAKVFSKTYDYVLSKTKSHVAAYGGALIASLESFMFSVLLTSTAYASYAYGQPFPQIFVGDTEIIAPFALGIGLLYAVFSPAILISMTYTQRSRFSTKSIEISEIRNDVKRLSEEFRHVWKTYVIKLANRDIGDADLQTLNAMYNMVTSAHSLKAVSGIEGLKEYNLNVLPTIEEALGRRISPNTIINHCPENIGGVTLIPTAILGKFTSPFTFGPVFVNKKRAHVAPNYTFALAHELAHASGNVSEPKANFHGMIAMDLLAKRFPFNGYDIYAIVNRLCFAVGALKEKCSNKDEFFTELDSIGTPKFVKEAFNVESEQASSPLPPVKVLLEKGIESKFSGLYIANSYVAAKMEKRKLWIKHNPPPASD